MARKVIVELVDDYDGESPAQETVSFALDSVAYEIDLSTLNAKKLRAVFEKWSGNARRVGRAPRTKSQAKPAAEREDTQKIREWARKNDLAVSNRGRISADVVEAYKKAH
ncbi:histone-like nucleoid-structuring protein Lsr2 [Nocardia takedensis]|uniref:histone-like nucleoid-structuring protein Lsr2 n=1 Tax=Nocardia takedensis TaxID=259390 RepID=UPI00030B845E|nr:Lsr2 family protein [Nocardia takedensis]